MDYLHTHSNISLRYYASDMQLWVDSNAAYLVLPQARSRLAGYFYLGDDLTPTISQKPNGAVLVECKTICHVVSSSAEAEVAGVFHNAKQAIPIRHSLQAFTISHQNQD